MRGYIQPGNTITLPAPYAVASGDGLLVGAIFGIATGSAAINAEVETSQKASSNCARPRPRHGSSARASIGTMPPASRRLWSHRTP